MKKQVLFLIFFIPILMYAAKLPVCPDSNENDIPTIEDITLDEFFLQADKFFQTYVSAGKVDYSSIKTEKKTLDILVSAIANTNISAADKNTSLAFYINAYNILVIKTVCENFPVKSPLDIAGFFDTKKHSVAGIYLTLNELENKKLRPDPRVHFSLVCAALSCPEILNAAFMPDKVQAQLDAQTKKAINDAVFIKVDNTTKKAQLSMIFDWYKEDFIKNSGSVLNYINSIKSTDIPADYIISYYEYNWKLNGK